MPRVRSSLLWMVLALATPAEGTENPLEIVTNESVRVYDRGMQLTGHCRTDHHVYACADWVTERFDTRCERAPEGWRLVVTARFDVVIHLSDVRFLPHELRHIRDVEQGLPTRLGSLLAVRFTEKEPCGAIARMVSTPNFTRTVMNRLRAASNLERGCTSEAWRKRGTSTARPESWKPE